MTRTARTWRKSSFSSAQGNCVEVSAAEEAAVAVRDSKDVSGPELGFTSQAWTVFVQAVKRGEFDL
jgi:hypothetical protein